MAELILGPMLRFVSERAATVWAETDQPCTVDVLGRSAHTFTVAGHHYALVVVSGLQPDSTYEYDVRLDGVVRWPQTGSALPRSRIRTQGGGRRARMVFGSCRTAAPHEAPWTLALAQDLRGRGVDALRTYAVRMVDQDPADWPDLAIMIGDQVYADDSSPRTRERIAAVRHESVTDERKPDPQSDSPSQRSSTPPAELVGGFEEFTWLYHESWSPEMERWFFSTVPTVMIFDDHDMIDDWNISDVWLSKVPGEPWWREHVEGGLMTYWLYQHLGNLSPEVIAAEGLLEELCAQPDGADTLRAWARRADLGRDGDADAALHPVPARDRYRFAFVRDIERVRLVMIDSRNARVLEPGQRRMVDEEEWDWIVAQCRADVDHLLIGTSLPVFVPVGLHDAQVWNEAVCDGAWGRLGYRIGQWLRVKADMEDWASFGQSFEAFVELLGALAAPADGNGPATVSVLSGDIHFCYAAEILLRRGADDALTTKVHQLVSSPIRNALRPPESTAMKIGASRVARVIGRLLRRAAGRSEPPVEWRVDLGPVFANSVGEIDFDGRSGSLLVLQTQAHDDEAPPKFDEGFRLDLCAGSRATALASADA